MLSAVNWKNPIKASRMPVTGKPGNGISVHGRGRKVHRAPGGMMTPAFAGTDILIDNRSKPGVTDDTRIIALFGPHLGTIVHPIFLQMLDVFSRYHLLPHRVDTR